MVYTVLGWCAVVLALVGLVLPGLPTTIFVLAASYCFSRSSPRFRLWLRDTRWLGPPLRQFEAAGGMSWGAKRAALAAMWTAVLLSSLLLLSTHWAAAAVTIALGGIGTLAIIFGIRSVPDAPPSR